MVCDHAIIITLVPAGWGFCFFVFPGDCAAVPRLVDAIALLVSVLPITVPLCGWCSGGCTQMVWHNSQLAVPAATTGRHRNGWLWHLGCGPVGCAGVDDGELDAAPPGGTGPARFGPCVQWVVGVAAAAPGCPGIEFCAACGGHAAGA